MTTYNPVVTFRLVGKFIKGESSSSIEVKSKEASRKWKIACTPTGDYSRRLIGVNTVSLVITGMPWMWVPQWEHWKWKRVEKQPLKTCYEGEPRPHLLNIFLAILVTRVACHVVTEYSFWNCWTFLVKVPSWLC